MEIVRNRSFLALVLLMVSLSLESLHAQHIRYHEYRVHHFFAVVFAAAVVVDVVVAFVAADAAVGGDMLKGNLATALGCTSCWDRWVLTEVVMFLLQYTVLAVFDMTKGDRLPRSAGALLAPDRSRRRLWCSCSHEIERRGV